MKKLLPIAFIIAVLFVSCQEQKISSGLPYYGPKETNEKGDTVYHQVPAFSFVNQDGEITNQEDVNGKIYVADFFFVKCEGICPKMAKQLQRVQQRFRNDSTVMFISHTVNPEEDSVEVLARYAAELKADTKQWTFVTGGKKELYDMARNGYYLTVLKGDGGPDDFIHSENFILVDPGKRIRGIYDGTNPAEVDRMMRDIAMLKQEFFGTKE